MIGIKIVFISFFVSYGTTITIDDDADRTTCEIAIAKGYPCEIHRVTTADGYKLEVHRITKGKNSPKASNKTKKVVLLQHGLEDSSATWVMNMETQSLGFIAADANLDVWMGNMRGNVYCRNHSKLNATDPLFWNFTFNEMAKYDLPDTITYILSYTKQQSLYYVGHSQGTQIGFILFSDYPFWSKSRVKQFHALAPVAWLGSSTSPIRTLAPLITSIAKLIPSSAYTQFNHDNNFGAAWGSVSCTWLSCMNYATWMTNSDLNQCNKSRNSVYNAKIPSGTSTLNIWHDLQLMLDGKFETYGDTPVPYHIEKSVMPTYLYWSGTDAFTHPDDVAILKNTLRTVVKEYRNDTYNHIDFVWSLNAAQDIYSQIINAITLSS